MSKSDLYAEIKTSRYEGVYKVKEVSGSIVAVDIDNKTTDFYLNKGEVVRFCTKDFKNYRFEL